MLAQTFNFALVFTILYLIAAKPLKKLMADRHTEITTGLDNAEKAKSALVIAESEKKKIEKDAHLKASEIVKKADEQGKILLKDTEDKANKEKQMIVESGRVAVEKERQAMAQTLNKETAEAVVMSVEKILRSSITEEKGDKLIKEILAKS